VKVTAAAADLVRREPDGVVVLLYHQIDGPRPSAVNLSGVRFREQLEYIKARGVVTLDDAVAAVRRGPTPIVRRPRLAVTFDDGTADFVESALPLLVEFDVPATLYIATEWVDENRSFWDDGTVLSWSALREAASTGLVTFGSHTHTHALLDRLPADEIASELDRSIASIEDNLGMTPRHFAYPKALRPSPAADLAVRARFDSAAIAGTRANPFRATDPYLLTRSPVQVGDGMTWFHRKAEGGMRLEDELREVVNRRRYAGATR
jgi:peptidoglycan/xylan/chitin deacetylase (PgdA/CDA1 family)